MMNHLGKSAFFVVCCLTGLPCVAASDGTTTMYKLVDPQGRVTYSNTPIAGAVRVSLEPITVLVNTSPTPTPPRPQTAVVTPTVAPVASQVPTGDTTITDDAGPSVVPVAVVTPVISKLTAAPKSAITRPLGSGSSLAPRPVYTATEIISPSTPFATPPMQVAVVTSIAHPKIKHLPLPAELQPPSEDAARLKAATVLTPTATAMPVAAPKLAPPIAVAVVTAVPSKLAPKQAAKPAPVQPPIQAAIESEQKLLAAAKAALDEESGQSEGVRAIKATFNASAKNNINNGGVNNAGIKLAQVPVITAEERQKVVRHFDRIRDLQDEIAAHEKTLDDLRRELSSGTNSTNGINGKSAPANTVEHKTATLAAASNLH